MTVFHLFQDDSFDADATQIMGQAFDRACVALREFGKSTALHEIMAKRIIEVAKTGERDPDRLCAQALKAFAAPKPPSQPAARAHVAPLQPGLRSRAQA
jgi:hypothetical protein